MDAVKKLQAWLAKVNFNGSREDFYKNLALAMKHDEPVADFLQEEIKEALKYKEPGTVLLCGRMLRRQNEQEGRLAHMMTTIVPLGDVFALSGIDEVDKSKKIEGLYFLADSIVRVRAMTGMIFKALETLITMLPIFLAFALIDAIILVPEYEQMMPVERWPAIGKAIYAISYVVRNYWFALAILFVGSIAAFIWSLNNWTGKYRVAADGVFPYFLYRNFHSSIFLVRLAQLLKTDKSLNEALLILRARAAPWLRWHIDRFLRNMTRYGEDYGQIINTGIFSRRMQKQIRAQAKYSGFREALLELGGSGMNMLMEDMSKIASRVNKVSLIFCFGGLIFFHFGMQYTSNVLISQLKAESAPVSH